MIELKNQYAGNQLWFEFVEGYYPAYPREETYEAVNWDRGSRDMTWDKKTVDSPQCELPFCRRISHNQYGRLIKANFPTFDRHPNGEYLKAVAIIPNVAEWLEGNENLLMRYYVIGQRVVHFETMQDYFLAILSGKFAEHPAA